MAECKKMMQLCEESLDRTLTPDEQNMLDRHLKECPACAAYLADLRFLSDALGETPELPAGLHDRIISGIRKETHNTVIQTHSPVRVRRMPVAAMLTAAAACVVLVLSGALGDLMNNNFQLVLDSGGGSNGSGGMDAGSAAPAEAVTSGSAAPAGVVPHAETTNEDGTMGNGTVPYHTTDAASAKVEKSTETQSRTANPPDEQHNETAMPRLASMPEDDRPLIAGDEPVAFSSDIVQPQVGAFISNVMEGEIFAACYLVEGGSDLPDIGQEQQRDDGFAYYVADNNLAQLETLLDSLEKAGCTVNRYEESGVLFNETAKRVIIVVRLES